MEFLKSKAFWAHLAVTILPVMAVAVVPVLQATGNPVALAAAMVLTNLAAYYHGHAQGQVSAPTAEPAKPVETETKPQ